MGIINRFLWLINACMSLCVAVAVGAVWLNVVPEAWWLNEWHYVLTRSEAALLIAIYLLLNLHLLACVFSGSQKKETAPKEFVLLHGVGGDTKVATAALTALVERVAASVMSVREAKANITAKDNDNAESLQVKLKLAVLTEAKVEEISARVTAAVQSQLKQTMSLDNVPVEVAVTGITNAPVEKRRVK